MIFILLLFYLAFVAVIAAGVGTVLRMILPGFPFWLCFLVAFACTFFTLVTTMVLIGAYMRPK